MLSNYSSAEINGIKQTWKGAVKDKSLLITTLFVAVAIVACVFYLQDKGTIMEHHQSSGVTVEWAPFEVADGVSEETLLQASERVHNEFLVKQKGFIKRELLKGDNDLWVDVVYWASKEDAQLAIEDAANSQACGGYFELMTGVDHDNLGEGVSHFSRIGEWK